MTDRGPFRRSRSYSPDVRLRSGVSAGGHVTVDIVEPDILHQSLRKRSKSTSSRGFETSVDLNHVDIKDEVDNTFVVVPPENVIEANRMINNYKFGFKKWKSHVTSRPLSARSDIVKELYTDLKDIKPAKVSTFRPTTVLYVALFGWWIALIYLLVSIIMAITIIGRAYTPYCWKMALYFLWPFGKFIYLVRPFESVSMQTHFHQKTDGVDEQTTLLHKSKTNTPFRHPCRTTFWMSLRSYPWLLLGAPMLLVVHGIVGFLTWFFVVTIPIGKVNMKTISTVLWLPPDRVLVGDSSSQFVDPDHKHTEIIMYTHQFVNIYYYKYTVDGMNIILANLLVFVVLALVVGYIDPENKHTSGVVKCILAVLAIIPLTYYIGMAIISISAQSSFAIGAVLNATFGSLVELILYFVALKKGRDEESSCYAELVKSALTGTLIGSILFIPGICMIVGGIKYQSQKFNPKSASITAVLLFVAVGGIFAPSIFSKIFGDLHCAKCETNSTTFNVSTGLQCSGCTSTILGLNHDRSLYKQHIEPLVYAISLLLPIAYVIGVIFTLKTHSSYVHDEFYEQMRVDEDPHGGGHGAPQWSRLKSIVILLVCATLIALASDLITDNIQDLLEASGISEYFIGVTMIAMIPELPEIVNGVQFALQNNVNLGIEIGTNTAIQVCLIQVPVLVLINLIYPVDFILIFNDVHLWAVVFSIIVINYIFQDGKSDYFQGSGLVAIYLILLCMYFVVPLPANSQC